MKERFLAAGLAVSLVFTALPARASQLRTFDAGSIAAGNYPTLVVWPGVGLTIDLTELNEPVKQVWLDDPSKLALDYAGQLCASACSGGVNVLHVKRIQGLHFANLPATSKTSLTIVTAAPSGDRVYKFLLSYGSGSPGYLTAALKSKRTPLPAALTAMTVRRTAPDLERIATLKRGLAVAREMLDDTVKNRLVCNRAALFITDLEAGYGEQEALRRNHLAPRALSTILQFGADAADTPGASDE